MIGVCAGMCLWGGGWRCEPCLSVFCFFLVLNPLVIRISFSELYFVFCL